MFRPLASSLLLAVLALSSTVQAGNVKGKIHHFALIKPGDTQYYPMFFHADKSLVIIVDGQEDSELDCYLYEGNDKLISTDTSPGSTCTFYLTKATNVYYRLRVVSRDNPKVALPSGYILDTN